MLRQNQNDANHAIGPGSGTTAKAIALFNGTDGLTLSEGSFVESGGDIYPKVDGTQSAGLSTNRFNTVRGNMVVGVRGAGTIQTHVTPSVRQGGFFGRSDISASGTAIATHGAGVVFQPVITAVNAFASSTSTARAVNIAGGSSMFGSAYSLGSSTAEIKNVSTSYGSFTGGYAFTTSGTTGTGKVENLGAGAFLWGYVQKNSGSGTSQIQVASTGDGAFCAGRVNLQGNHTIRAAGSGSFVQGKVTSSTSSTIESTVTGSGAFAQGYASGGGTISSGGAGSFAQGSSTAGYMLRALGNGAFAVGSALTGNITATGTNVVQFGIGANAVADTVQVGTAGLRFKGSAGLTGTPQIGDFAVNAGYVYIYSNAQWCKVTNAVL